MVTESRRKPICNCFYSKQMSEHLDKLWQVRSVETYCVGGQQTVSIFKRICSVSIIMCGVCLYFN